MERALTSTQALAGIETSRSPVWTREQVLSNPARIAVICYSSTSRIHLNGWSGDIMQVDAAAYRMDVKMAVANVS